MPCTPGGTTTPNLGLCKPAAGETPWTTAINGNWDILDTLQASVVARGYLAGLTLSTAGSSATMTIAAGQAVESGNTSVMVLGSALNKTTSAWAVGSNNGGLDTGAIAPNTTYHFFLIKRVDTNVVDGVMSLSPSAPTLPASYTLKRRIGAGRTDGSSNWTAFIQDGDYFRWLASILDVNTTNPGATAVTATLTVPTGINVFANINVMVKGATSNELGLYVSDPAANDEGVGITVAPLASTGFSGTATVTTPGCNLLVRTNTSAQVRYRLSASGAADIVRIATLGWYDSRGRNG